MKAKFFSLPVLSVLFAVVAFAGTPASFASISASSALPSLRLDDVRFDAKAGKIRGTARVNSGYAAPIASHVSIYALDSSGKILFKGCDSLSRQSLTGHPRLPGYRTRGDAFSVRLPVGLTGVRSVQVIAETGHGEGCNPKENRIWNLFK